MARDGSGVFSSAVADVETNTEISSSHFNAFKADLVADANLDRPIAAGGTGASTAAAARTNLEVAKAQTSVNDATSGSGLIVGAFGLGGHTPTSSDWGAEIRTKFLRTEAASTAGAPTTDDIWTGQHINRNSTEAVQLAAAPSTAAEWVRFKTASAWGNWFKRWHGGNVKGTVSQSSDVPTGALFEEGSSSGIYYERFACGKQVIYIPGQVFEYLSTSRLQATITFPKAFVSVAYAVSAVPALADPTAAESTFTTGTPGINASQVQHNIIPGTRTTSGMTASVYRIDSGVSFAPGYVLYFDITINGRWYA